MENLFARKIVPEIEKYLDEPGIILITGARQVGKTSIMRLLIDKLKGAGVAEKRIHYFDLEDLDLLDIFNSGVKAFLGYLTAHGADISEAGMKHYVFADEIQYMANPANFLKLIADHHKNLKLIVSGSSTLEIRRKFKDSLAGRKVVFEVYPLDFSEFLVFKREQALCDTLLKSDIRHLKQAAEPEDIPARLISRELTAYFNEFMIFGGYPKIVMEQEHEKKTAYLTEIYTAYVKKDIKDIMRVDNIAAFNSLLKALALQTGSLANLHELGAAIKAARETLERYLFLLENTFIIRTITPFSGNQRKEISKMPKIYFIDTGLRNIIIRNLNEVGKRADAGALAENAVCSNMLKNLRPLEDIHFWRTLSKSEVDFILLSENKPRPVEVKYSDFRILRVPPGMRHFHKDYRPEQCLVLTKNQFGSAGHTLFLPIWLC